MSTPTPVQPVRQFFERDIVKKRFESILGNNANQFITSVLQIATNNRLLSKAEPDSIYNAAMLAATINLPINQNLGFAWIVPYKGKAQFQIGWRGFVQLALRTGQYSRINVVEVYSNQFNGYNTLTEELSADFSIEGNGDVVGYASYFKLINGFEKTTFWRKERVVRHAKRYSEAYKNDSAMSPWKDVELFHEMAKKTVLKNTLSKWGILSIEMQKAIHADQAVLTDDSGDNVVHIDAVEPQKVSKEDERLILMIKNAKSIEDLNAISVDDVSPEVEQAYMDARESLLSKMIDNE